MSRLVHVSSLKVLVSFILLGCLVAWGQRPESLSQPNLEMSPIIPSAERQTPHVQRIRERTAFKEMHVFFRQVGDRTAVYTVDDDRHFTCLENLTLERILTTMQEKPERRFWKIEGEFTEFRGENFVLLRRAVAAQSPAVVAP